CKVPFLYLAAAAPLTDFAKLRELCSHVVIGQTVGAGHFHQLEVPEQVNAMIDRFLDVCALRCARREKRGGRAQRDCRNRSRLGGCTTSLSAWIEPTRTSRGKVEPSF